MAATVRDVMSKVVLTLDRDASLSEAVSALSTHGVSGAPVCDGRGRLVGVVSKGDLAEASAGLRGREYACVGEVMAPEVETVGPETPLQVVAQRMVFEGVHRVVVTDADGTIVGIVTPLDVLRAIVAAGPIEVAPPPPEGDRFPSWPNQR